MSRTHLGTVSGAIELEGFGRLCSFSTLPEVVSSVRTKFAGAIAVDVVESRRMNQSIDFWP